MKRNQMRTASRRVAVCGLLTALSVVLMVISAPFGVLIYVCPLLLGGIILLIRQAYGVRYALTTFCAVSLLVLILVADLEMTAIYIGFFGWYPVAKGWLDKRGKILGRLLKLLCFNGAVAAVYIALAAVLGMERLGLGGLYLSLLLLAVGNMVFLLYDLMLKRMSGPMPKGLEKLFFAE